MQIRSFARKMLHLASALTLSFTITPPADTLLASLRCEDDCRPARIQTVEACDYLTGPPYLPYLCYVSRSHATPSELGRSLSEKKGSVEEKKKSHQQNVFEISLGDEYIRGRKNSITLAQLKLNLGHEVHALRIALWKTDGDG